MALLDLYISAVILNAVRDGAAFVAVYYAVNYYHKHPPKNKWLRNYTKATTWQKKYTIGKPMNWLAIFLLIQWVASMYFHYRTS